MNSKETVSRFLEAEGKQDVQGMADVLAEDIVFEMPFLNLPGLPNRVEGKGPVVEFLEQFGNEHGMFTGWDFTIFGSIPPVTRILSSLNWMGKVW